MSREKKSVERVLRDTVRTRASPHAVREAGS